MPGALTRWEPFAELGELRRIFDETFRDGERAWMPAIDVVRDDGNLLVRADIPGIKPEEIKVGSWAASLAATSTGSRSRSAWSTARSAR